MANRMVYRLPTTSMRPRTCTSLTRDGPLRVDNRPFRLAHEESPAGGSLTGQKRTFPKPQESPAQGGASVEAYSTATL